eukprot:SM000097S24838  [mRNA]  locus=s97:458041:458838:- [translate_table: standard]
MDLTYAKAVPNTNTAPDTHLQLLDAQSLGLHGRGGVVVERTAERKSRPESPSDVCTPSKVAITWPTTGPTIGSAPAARSAANAPPRAMGGAWEGGGSLADVHGAADAKAKATADADARHHLPDPEPAAAPPSGTTMAALPAPSFAPNSGPHSQALILSPAGLEPKSRCLHPPPFTLRLLSAAVIAPGRRRRRPALVATAAAASPCCLMLPGPA